MANLCIKTPSSAILVLIFQLLVLRPRPNVDDEAKQSFTVIYEMRSAKAKKWCSEHQWRYLKGFNIFGSEDQGVILLDLLDLSPELISRGRNLLVIVTARGKTE